MSRWLQWRDGRLEEVGPPTDPLRLADSFRIEAGRARAADRHFGRFAKSANESPYGDFILPFLDVASETLSSLSDAFPRLEWRFHPDEDAPPNLFLQLRPLPPRPTPPARVARAAGPDPRRFPRIKGPDLELGRRLREAAPAGVDEVLLTDGEGRLLEGVWSSLVHWREDTLILPPEEAPVLRGVTRDLLLELAAESDTPVAREWIRPGDLAGCECWLLSAGVGLRPIGATTPPDPAPGPPTRAALWSERLDLLATPIADLPTRWRRRYT